MKQHLERYFNFYLDAYCTLHTHTQTNSFHANVSRVTLEKPSGIPEARVKAGAPPFKMAGAAGADVCDPAKNRWFCDNSRRFSSSWSVKGDTYPFSCEDDVTPFVLEVTYVGSCSLALR